MNPVEYLKKYGNPITISQDLIRLEKGEPVQYIIGNVDFYGCSIVVNPNVLIPRFETEGLVEKIIQKNLQYHQTIKIADLGTGSGCIAIALKKHLKCEVDAVDISKKALEVARQNAKDNHVEITFYEGDFLKPLTGMYDVIVSNPPYISYNEEIMELVKNNEPKIALYAEQNGYACYYKIIKNAKNHLKKGGLLAFEIGYQQGNELKKYAQQIFQTAYITVERDLQGKERYLFIENI